MIRPWKVTGSEPVFDGRIFQVRRDLTINPRTGQTHEMFVLDQPDWVNVIPLTPHEHVVMVEQWRHGSRTIELETPGGLMDPGETPEACARRELLEETGYAADRLIHLGTVKPNPAIQSNVQHYLLATGCHKVAEPNLDHAEDIAVRLVPLIEIPDLIRAGRITHGIVIGGFHLLSLRGAPS